MERSTISNIDQPERHDALSPRQVAPRHEVELEGNLDRERLVRDLIRGHPGATADEITEMLAKRRIKISSTLVLQELQRG